MDKSVEKKSDKKEIIKLLTLGNVAGTETLYTKIPFFMRTRMEGLIDNIQWERIKHGCDHGDLVCLNEATKAYQDLLKKIKEYLQFYAMAKKEARTDDMMLMRTDLNFIQANYGTDAVSFVAAMAECIQKEDELIDNYGGELRVNESAVVFNENVGIYMLPEMDSSASDIVLVEQQPEIISIELTEISNAIALLKEYLSDFQNGSFFDNQSLILVDQETTGNSTEQTLIGIFNLLDLLNKKMSSYVGTLESQVSEWRTARAKASVKVGPKASKKKLEKSFSYFGELLKALLSLFQDEELISRLRASKTNEVALYQTQFENIKKSFFLCNLVVYIEPKDLMSIESVGNRKSKDVGAGPPGAKTKRKYCTKKKNSFTTEVRLLGGQHFQVEFQQNTIELVAEKDLAEGKNGKADQSSELDYQIKAQTEETRHSVKFEKVAIKSFSRVEQNHIYKQFFRLKYNLIFIVDDSSYKRSILSQPFMFNTGSNQILELIAARMWYCANFDLYNGNFICEDTLDVEVVLDMLDARVANLHPTCSRHLTPEEREFLKSRLPNSSGERITMQGFIKDKMKKTRAADQELGFPFHTWFYAVLYSIQTHLLRPWFDGVIFGFCCEVQARELLKSLPVGTFIIRPSISREINSMSSREASADLTIDIKMYKDNPGPDGEQYHIQSIPLLMPSVISYSLYGAIAGIKKNNDQIAKYCLTNKMEKKNIAYLRTYSPGDSDKTNQNCIPDYRLITQVTQQVKIQEMGPDGEANFKDGPQLKRPFSNTSSVAAPPPSVVQQPMQQMEINIEDIQNLLGPYSIDDGATGQGLRSGHQSNCLPVHNDVGLDNDQGIHGPGSFILRLDSGFEVDTSKLPTFVASPDQAEIAAKFLVQQIGNPNIQDEAHIFSALPFLVDPNSNLTNADPHPKDLYEISPYGNGVLNFLTGQTGITDNHHIFGRNVPARAQYKRFNSNPPSNVSTSTTSSSYNYSPTHSQEDISWNSPSDSGIDQDHTPSPPSEETSEDYPITDCRIDLI